MSTTSLPSGERTIETKPRTVRRGNGRLLTGLGVAVLVLVNVGAFAVPPEVGVDALRYSPPHSWYLQRLFQVAGASDRAGPDLNPIAGASSGDARADSQVFRSIPDVTTRVGRPYHYHPEASVPLHHFVLTAAPPGLVIDSVTGELSGSVDTSGRFDVTLQAEDATGRSHMHAFTLFVDTRYLLLGADGRGRDVVRQLLYSARYSLLPGSIAVLIGVGGGLLLGAIGGYYGGRAAAFVGGLVALIEAIPGLLLIFVVAVSSGFRLNVVMAVVGVVLLPETARTVMQGVAALRAREFVEAARELGMPDAAILWKEIIWYNGRKPLITRVVRGFAAAILIQVTLDYMHLTTQDQSSLGSLLLDGRMALIGSDIQWVAIGAVAGILLLLGALAVTEAGLLAIAEER